MATTKKPAATAAKTETKATTNTTKAETAKPATTKAATKPVAEKAATATKPAAKKTTTKPATAAKTTAAKPAAKKTAAKKTSTTKKATEPTVNFTIEFGGNQESYSEIIENIKKTYAANGGDKDIKTLDVFVKPEENAAYFVVNGELEDTQKMDVYFS